MVNLLNTIGTIKAQKLSSRDAVVFDWVIVVLGLWMIGGAHLQAWAQHQFIIETYFSFWRSIWYFGYIAISIALSGMFLFNLKRSKSLRNAIPVGYEFSLVGVVVFLIGASVDAWLHKVFDIGVILVESINPWHVLLAVGSVLIISGPLRATRRRTLHENQRWMSLMPALLSLALMLAEFSFFASQSHPLSRTILGLDLRTSPDEIGVQSLVAGISTILVQSALLSGVILFSIQRLWLPVGGITLIITIAYGLTISIHENFMLMPFEILAGLGAEIFYWWLKPFLIPTIRFRWFAFGLPILFYMFYFLVLAITNGVMWPLHIWTGTILLSGVTGWLLSYAFVPPQFLNRKRK